MSTSTRRTVRDLEILCNIIEAGMGGGNHIVCFHISFYKQGNRYYIERNGEVIADNLTFAEAYSFLEGVCKLVSEAQSNWEKFQQIIKKDHAEKMDELKGEISHLKVKLEQRQTGCDELIKLENKLRDKTLVPSLASIRLLLSKGKSKRPLSGPDTATIEGWKHLLMQKADMGMFSFPPKMVFQLLPAGTDVDSIARSCEALMPYAQTIQWALLDEFEKRKSNGPRPIW